MRFLDRKNSNVKNLMARNDRHMITSARQFQFCKKILSPSDLAQGYVRIVLLLLMIDRERKRCISDKNKR